MTNAEAAIALLTQARAERQRAVLPEVGGTWGPAERARRHRQFVESQWRTAIAKRCERWAEKLMLGEWPK